MSGRTSAARAVGRAAFAPHTRATPASRASRQTPRLELLLTANVPLASVRAYSRRAERGCTLDATSCSASPQRLCCRPATRPAAFSASPFAPCAGARQMSTQPKNNTAKYANLNLNEALTSKPNRSGPGLAQANSTLTKGGLLLLSKVRHCLLRRCDHAQWLAERETCACGYRSKQLVCRGPALTARSAVLVLCLLLAVSIVLCRSLDQLLA
eukprot:313180-Chlamydomonas_euryale.AAC.10